MLAREGCVPVSVVAVAAAGVAVVWSPLLSVLGFVLLLVVVRVFWEREPQIPAIPLAVLSPVDGRVVSVDLSVDPWLQREAIAICLKPAFPGVTCLRSPTEGKAMDFFTNLGATDAPPNSPTAYVMWVQTDELEDVSTCVATYRYSRYRGSFAPGERIGQGSRSGFVFFSSLVTVYMPPGTLVRVETGAKVRIGTSVIATLVRQSG